MQISYKRFSESTVFPRVDSGRLLACCLGAHNESFGAIGLSFAITSRYKYRKTRLHGDSAAEKVDQFIWKHINQSSTQTRRDSARR